MSKPIYQFAGIELDCARREIRVGRRRQEIPPQVFDLLEFLARHHNQVVSKDELANALWPNRIVTDASITQAVRKARAALEKCGADPTIIRNQHGHGYRLEANVSVIAKPEESNEWRKHPFRTGAIIAVLGGILVTAANISDVLTWVLPDESAQLLEATQTTVLSTDAKVDELVQLLRNQAARSGAGLDPEAEGTIRDALRTLVESVDARKNKALNLLAEGDVAAAAESLVAVAEDMDIASDQSVDAAAASWREAGVIYYTIDIAKAVSSFESAHRLRPDDTENTINLGYAYIRAGRLDDALTYFETLTDASVADDARVFALRGMGIVHTQRADYSKARSYLHSAMELLGDSDNLRQRGLILLQLGAIDRAQGNNDAAEEHIETVVSYAEVIDDAHLRAEALNNLGVIMATKDNYDRAFEALAAAHDIYTDRNDLAGQAKTLGNLGAAALKQGDVTRAEPYLLESVEIGERLGWQQSIVIDLINLGGIAAGREQYDVAQSHLTRALDIADSARLDELLPLILANMGEVASTAGDTEEACRFWNEALPLLEKAEHAAAGIVAGSIERNQCD
jgi:DNA-binding winged helix-turn-helix (wHTH) protein/tetratricopeptide (TPR) repeat protein